MLKRSKRTCVRHSALEPGGQSHLKVAETLIFSIPILRNETKRNETKRNETKRGI